MAADNSTVHRYLKPAGFMSSTDHSGPLLIVNLVSLLLLLGTVALRIYLARRVKSDHIAIYKDDLFFLAGTVGSLLVHAHDQPYQSVAGVRRSRVCFDMGRSI